MATQNTDQPDTQPSESSNESGSSGNAGRYLWRLFVILLLVATGLGVYNVVGDGSNAEQLAKTTAGCTPNRTCITTRWERKAWEQNFTIQMGGSSINVHCQREYILLGNYQCKRL